MPEGWLDSILARNTHSKSPQPPGEYEAALKSLQTYVTYAKDTLHYPEARALIEKIEADD